LEVFLALLPLDSDRLEIPNGDCWMHATVLQQRFDSGDSSS